MRVTLICTIHGRAQNLKQVYLFSSCCNRAGAAAAAVAASNIWDQIWKLIVLCYTILYPLPGTRLLIGSLLKWLIIIRTRHGTRKHIHFFLNWCASFPLPLLCLLLLYLSSEKIKILIRKLSHSHYTWPDTYISVPTQFISLPLLAFQPDFTASLWNLIAKKTCCDILPVPICLFQYANLVMKSSLFNIWPDYSEIEDEK